MLFIFEKNRGIGGFEPNARGEEAKAVRAEWLARAVRC